MAYARKTRKSTGSGRKSTRRPARRSTGRKSVTGRRTAAVGRRRVSSRSGGHKTIRIVIEQPKALAEVRPLVAQSESKPKKAIF